MESKIPITSDEVNQIFEKALEIAESKISSRQLEDDDASMDVMTPEAIQAAVQTVYSKLKDKSSSEELSRELQNYLVVVLRQVLASKAQSRAKKPLLQSKILVLGLQQAGKTSIISQLHIGENYSCPSACQHPPTVGYDVATYNIHDNDVCYTIWDASGEPSQWASHFPKSHAVVFVVDSTDRNSLDEAQKELHLLFNYPALSKCIFLILANKSDLPGAMAASEVKAALKLGTAELRHRRIDVRSVSARTSSGLASASMWLADNVEKKKIKARCSIM